MYWVCEVVGVNVGVERNGEGAFGVGYILYTHIAGWWCTAESTISAH